MNAKVSSNSASVHRWLSACEATLDEHAERINRINIFPVADSDTGSNLHATVQAAHRAVSATVPGAEPDLGEVLHLAAIAAMENAQGNSGTLLSVFFASWAEALRGATRLDTRLVASALHRAQVRSWSALSEPVNGTMLSVLGAAASAAAASAAANDESNSALVAGLDAVVEAAVQSLAGTPNDLEVLAKARVVDAGAVGLVLVLECLRAVVQQSQVRSDLLDDVAGYEQGREPFPGAAEDERGVEVMCMITLTALDAATLRMRLDEMGDSVILTPVSEVGDGFHYRWRVHVHCPEAEVALVLLRSLGTPENVKITALSAVQQDPADPGIAT